MKAKKTRSVKLEKHLTAKATAKGGAALLEAVGNRTRLWSECRNLLPLRRDPSQGYPTENVVCALIHGLLCGGRGFSATEPMREDRPLLDMIGLDLAPSAETVEDVVKYLACEGVGGLERILDVMGRQSVRGLQGEKRMTLLSVGGFVPVFGDGSMLETDGKTKDWIKVYDGKAGQVTEGVFVGPYQVVSDFVREGEDERGCMMRHGDRIFEALRRTKLIPHALFLLDSHYGDGPFLDYLEKRFKGSRYIVGGNKLKTVGKILSDQPEAVWRDTTKATKKRGFLESAVCVSYIQCEDWTRKRVLVGRRWKKDGDLFYSYAGLITNLREDEGRVAKAMKKEGVSFAEVMWSWYDRKQGLENQWKGLLSDLGLHHPPSGKASVNAVFFAIAALGNNLSLICRRLLLDGENRRMALWRFRRDVIDVAAEVKMHAGRVIARVMDARERIFKQLEAAFARISRLQCVL